MAAGGSFPAQLPGTPRLSSTAVYEKKQVQIRSVWSSNLENEFHLIRQVVDRYPFISIDTEFPGVIFPRVSHINIMLETEFPGMVFKLGSHLNKRSHDLYDNLKSNVDALKLIQVGITLTDEAGNLPDLGEPFGHFIWEFNFCDFDVSSDDHNPVSIDLLRQQGMNFVETRESGITSTRFAELMVSSGLVCNEDITYISFHSAYDFGYLIKILTGQELPSSLEEFLELMKLFFGRTVYDVKQLIKYSLTLQGGLNRVARSLGLTRAAGKSHQAGSDSLLTWQVFQSIREPGLLEKYVGVLYGLDMKSDS